MSASPSLLPSSLPPDFVPFSDPVVVAVYDETTENALRRAEASASAILEGYRDLCADPAFDWDVEVRCSEAAGYISLRLLRNPERRQGEFEGRFIRQLFSVEVVRLRDQLAVSPYHGLASLFPSLSSPSVPAL